MQTTLVTQPEIFQLAAQRAFAYAEAGYPNCDSELIDILPKLNALPGIATLWSCASHVEVSGSDNQFYIAVAVTEEGMRHMVSIYEELSRIAQPKLDDETGCSLRLEFSRLIAGIFEQEDVRYNIMAIDCLVSDAANKWALLDSLAEALTNYRPKR